MSKEADFNGIITDTTTGNYYQVRFHWLPRPGELINLHSFVEAKDKNLDSFNFEVIKIRHDIQDVMMDGEKEHGGGHSVSVFVKPSHDAAFDD